MSWGGLCPYCKEPFKGKGAQESRIMGAHRTTVRYPFSTRRETCPYGGGTVEDAAAGITPRRRRQLNAGVAQL